MRNLAQYLKGKKHVIFDWNGTILNDTSLCVSVINTVLADHNLPSIDLLDYRKKFTFPVRTYYEAIGFDFTKVDFNVPSDMFVSRYNERVHECDLFDGSEELVEGLIDAGLDCSILSAAYEKDIHDLLAKHSIDHHFTHVAGLENTHAQGKVERGLELKKILRVPSRELILIGDTRHDYDVAKAMGIDALILADGHQDLSVLAGLPCKVLESRF